MTISANERVQQRLEAREAKARREQVLEKVRTLSEQMDEIGSTDMGWLSYRESQRFHRAADAIRKLAGRK